jgi:hypothetical protein
MGMPEDKGNPNADDDYQQSDDDGAVEENHDFSRPKRARQTLALGPYRTK